MDDVWRPRAEGETFQIRYDDDTWRTRPEEESRALQLRNDNDYNNKSRRKWQKRKLEVELHLEPVFFTTGHDDSDDEEENSQRGKWKSCGDFFMVILSNAIGLVNIWRFPYLCYRNGGAAFLIPYIILTMFCAMPLLMLQMVKGQYSSRSALGCLDYAPIFKGLGVSHLILTVFVSAYYTVIIAWAGHYLFTSLFVSPLPWSSCNNYWNTNDCSSVDGSSEEYFNNEFLSVGTTIAYFGDMNYGQLLSLSVVLLVICLGTVFGVKVTGKITYIMCIVPYILLLVLLVRAILLPGSSEGLNYLFYPDFERLLSAKTWNDAAVQTFFSLGVMGGMATSLASHNKFHHNILRDSVMVTFMNMVCSLLAGMTVFAFLGYLALHKNIPLPDVVAQGPGLVFIVIPHLVLSLPIPVLWSALFFLTVLLLGIGSMIAAVTHVVSCILDEVKGRCCPFLRPGIAIWTCIILFVLGSILCFQNGFHIIMFLDNYISVTVIGLLVLIDNISIAWFYGPFRLYKITCEMLQVSNLFYKITIVLYCFSWSVTSPVYQLTMAIMSIINYKPFYAKGVPYWSEYLGWGIGGFILVWIPIGAIYKMICGKQRIKALFQPQGPIWDKKRSEVIAMTPL